MNIKPSSSIRNSSLFKLYDIQNDFRKHKQKITQIKHRSAKQRVSKDYNSQLSITNQLKKNWITSEVNRTLSKQKQIYQQNKALYNQIIKVRNRPFDRTKIMSQSNILNRSQIRSSHSVNRQNSQRKIQKDNQKLMQKILTAKSPLSKDNMKEHYSKIKETKQRLQTYSSMNKSRMKTTLKKINVKQLIYLPQVSPSSKSKLRNATLQSQIINQSKTIKQKDLHQLKQSKNIKMDSATIDKYFLSKRQSPKHVFQFAGYGSKSKNQKGSEVKMQSPAKKYFSLHSNNYRK